MVLISSRLAWRRLKIPLHNCGSRRCRTPLSHAGLLWKQRIADDQCQGHVWTTRPKMKHLKNLYIRWIALACVCIWITHRASTAINLVNARISTSPHICIHRVPYFRHRAKREKLQSEESLNIISWSRAQLPGPKGLKGRGVAQRTPTSCQLGMDQGAGWRAIPRVYWLAIKTPQRSLPPLKPSWEERLQGRVRATQVLVVDAEAKAELEDFNISLTEWHADGRHSTATERERESPIPLSC